MAPIKGVEQRGNDNVLNRQRTILQLLSRSGGVLGRTAFVKLCFLLRHETALREDATFYDFVPYRFGPFSFVLYHELAGLARRGFVDESDDQVALSCNWKTKIADEIRRLPEVHRQAVEAVSSSYGSSTKSHLLRHIYTTYPFYASRSEVAKGYGLAGGPDKSALSSIYTIGYGGLSVDAFFAILLRCGIKRVIDVRHNPVSRKFGFSKSRLIDVGARLDIDYVHLPKLGIPGAMRKGLGDTLSHEDLFAAYEKGLAGKSDHLNELEALVAGMPSVMLCAEVEPVECHRGTLAATLSQRTGVPVVHLGGCHDGEASRPDHSQDVPDSVQTA